METRLGRGVRVANLRGCRLAVRGYSRWLGPGCMVTARSSYLRYVPGSEQQSVWIATRPGRMATRGGVSEAGRAVGGTADCSRYAPGGSSSTSPAPPAPLSSALVYLSGGGSGRALRPQAATSGARGLVSGTFLVPAVRACPETFGLLLESGSYRRTESEERSRHHASGNTSPYKDKDATLRALSKHVVMSTRRIRIRQVR